MEHLLHARHCGYSKSVSISNLNIWSPHLSSQRFREGFQGPSEKRQKRWKTSGNWVISKVPSALVFWGSQHPWLHCGKPEGYGKVQLPGENADPSSG